MAGFRFEIVTPEGTAFSGEAESAVVPAQKGYLGVLRDHAPLLCLIRPGKVTIRAGQTQRFAVGHGFFQVAANRAILLTDAVSEASKLDVRGLEAARNQALLATRDRPVRELERIDAWLRVARGESGRRV